MESRYTTSTNASSIPDALSVFHILEGKYTIGLPLRQNEYSITYLAMDLSREKQVIIDEYFPAHLVRRASDSQTVIPTGTMNSGRFQAGLQDFLKKGELLRQLAGISHIAHVQDMLCCNATAYLVTDYIPGISLKEQLILQKKPFTEQEALDLMHPILTALQAVHQKHMLHLDINTEHLLYCPDHTLVLTSFRMADPFIFDQNPPISALKQRCLSETACVTPDEPKPCTDIYDVCAVLYQMLTGRPPLDAKIQVTQKQDQLTPLSQVPSISVSAKTCRAVEKGLHLASQESYASVDDLIHALYDIPGVSSATDKIHLEDSQKNQQNTNSGSSVKTSFFRSPVFAILTLATGSIGLLLFFSLIAHVYYVQHSAKAAQHTVSACSSVLSETDAVLSQSTSAASLSSEVIGAAENTTSSIMQETTPQYVATVFDAQNGNSIGSYTSLAEAIAAVPARTQGQRIPEIQLLTDITEDIIIPADMELSIDFAGHTLTNVSEHTITNNGILYLSDGTLDNVSPVKAALYNTAGSHTSLTRMVVTRSQENGKHAQESETQNTYYTIDNQGELYIDSCQIENAGTYSSTIHNGSKQGSTSPATLFIWGSDTDISGGLFTLKNEPNGILTIEDGSFHSSFDTLIYNRGDLVIRGGVFRDAPSMLRYVEGTYEIGTRVTVKTDRDVDFETQ